MSPISYSATRLIHETSLEAGDYDSIVLVHTPEQKIFSPYIRNVIAEAIKLDKSLETEIAVLPVPKLAQQKLIYCPTGPIDPDYDDVRIIKTAALKAMKRALKSGSRKPLLLLETFPEFKCGALVGILGALQAVYTPIQYREFLNHNGRELESKKVEYVGICTESKHAFYFGVMLEGGRRIACDIADADPERMAPPKIEEYVVNHFKDLPINVSVVDDPFIFAAEYPLFEAVNRAASCQPRHAGRIVYLEYNPPEAPIQTLFLVGKGVTYDTGGIDVKIGGAMMGMSRDKCGAAACIGFMDIVAKLKPKRIKVVCGIGLVRNSIGSNGYVADELITARSGARVRVINTDAEGRMIMADILCKFKEEALNSINPHLFTIATLTGHACLTVGHGYSIVIDNGPAHKAGHSQRLAKFAEEIGDPFEISTLRKEDIVAHRGVAEGDDVVQGATKPSSQCARGHQGPVAFLLLASGLDKHGSGSDQPLKYSHMDIAASSGSLPDPATGSPVLALTNTYLLQCDTEK